MTAYYNDIENFSAAWIRRLIQNGYVRKGKVDIRSITDVKPAEVENYRQCHFFAGIAGWSHALQLAGWPEWLPVWTGSCPCQPFSAAGKGAGFDDDRHLWPDFFRLIYECRPPIVFGEQVASKDGLAWLDLVQDDMESAGYTFAAVDMCAAGFGAPHIRQRLYWVGIDTLGYTALRGRVRREFGSEASPQCCTSGAGEDEGRGRDDAPHDGAHNRVADPESWGNDGQIRHNERCKVSEALGGGGTVRVAHTESGGMRGGSCGQSKDTREYRAGCGTGGVEHASGDGRLQGRDCNRKHDRVQSCSTCDTCGMGDTYAQRCEGERLQRIQRHEDTENSRASEIVRLADTASEQEHEEQQRPAEYESGRCADLSGGRGVVDAGASTGPTNGFWGAVDWLFCRDGKWRPVEPGTFPLAHGVSNRVGRLRGYGNAIVPPQAKEFIGAVMEYLDRIA